MCRFALYLGRETTLDALITEPRNSLIHQSFQSREREEPLNGDGFGVAWYPPRGEPAVFKSVQPAWSSRNLRHLARVTRSRAVLAHVRAATPGLPVTELNCHPFLAGRLSFMHNGRLGGFQTTRRRLLEGLSDAAYAGIEGSTDSEHLFAVFLDHFDRLPAADPPTERLVQALERTIATAEALRRRFTPDEPSLLNLVVCDGERAVVCRYADGAPANSLYVASGCSYRCEDGLSRLAPADGPPEAVLVVSEPLTEDDLWTRVEPGHLVVVEPDLRTSIRPIRTPAEA